MEFADLVRRRRMTRDFLADPIDDSVLERVFEAARRVPSAGNSQGCELVVLNGPAETAHYWDAALPAPRRETFRWKGLLVCPVLVTVWADPAAYVSRYAESDKQRTGLGAGPDAWPTPYWIVDASFAAMALQYAALDEGLGVLFFGMFNQAPSIAAALDVPADLEPIGTLGIGWPEPGVSQGLGASAGRPRRPMFDDGEASDSMRPLVHRGRYRDSSPGIHRRVQNSG